MGHIFISYSRIDQEYTRRLGQDIRNHGFDVWMDDRIDFGDRWWQTIVKAIRECNAFLVVMSPEAEKSEWVEREVLLAQREKKPVFPVLLRGREFALLITAQYTDARQENLPGEEFYDRLRRVMQGQMPIGMTSIPPIPQEKAPPVTPGDSQWVTPQQAAQPKQPVSQPPPAFQPQPRPQPAQPVYQHQPAAVHAQTPAKRSTFYIWLGVGIAGAILLLCIAIAVISSLNNDENGGNAVENTERFLQALGAGNLDAADRYVCNQNQGLLASTVYNAFHLAWGVQLGIDGTLDNINCRSSGSNVTCSYWVNTSFNSLQGQDTFIMDDNKVCDLAFQ